MNSPVYYAASFLDHLVLDSHELFEALVASGYYPDDIIASRFIRQEDDSSAIYRVVFNDDGDPSEFVHLKVWIDEEGQILADYA